MTTLASFAQSAFEIIVRSSFFPCEEHAFLCVPRSILGRYIALTLLVNKRKFFRTLGLYATTNCCWNGTTAGAVPTFLLFRLSLVVVIVSHKAGNVAAAVLELLFLSSILVGALLPVSFACQIGLFCKLRLFSDDEEAAVDLVAGIVQFEILSGGR